MAQQKFKLKPTKSTFKLKGVITKWNEESLDSRDNMNKLRFNVKTSSTGSTPVQVIGWKSDEVTVSKWNNEKKQFEQVKLKWENRKKVPEGYSYARFNSVRLKPHKDYKGSIQMLGYDAASEIFDTFQEGQGVYVTGEMRFSKFNDRVYRNFEVKYIQPVDDKDVDFESDDFKELAVFEQEAVFVSIDQEEEGRYVLTGRVIEYGDKWQDVQFIIDTNEDGDLKELANNLQLYANFGMLLKLNGKVVNKVVTEEVQGDMIQNMFGGKRSGSFGTVAKRIVSELQVTYVEPVYDAELQPITYKEEDFVPLVVEGKPEKQKPANPFATKKEKDPIANMFDDDEDEIDFDDPFADA